LVIALFAGVRAEAEADPQLLVHSPLVHSPLVYGLAAHHAVPHIPVVKSIEVKPAEVKTTTPVVTYSYPYLHAPYFGLWGHGLPLTGAPAAAAEAEAPAVETAERKKREADAEAEADPYYLTYGVRRPYVHYPYVYTTPVVKPAVKTVKVKAPAVTYAYHHALPYAYGYPYTYGYHPYVVTKPVEAEAEAVEAERKKRDADADPAILASSTIVKTPVTTYTHPLTYTTLPYATHGVYANYGYPYAHGYHPYTYRGVYPYTYGYHPYVVTKPVEAEAEAVEAERK